MKINVNQKGKVFIEFTPGEAKEILHDIEMAVGIPAGYMVGSPLQSFGLALMNNTKESQDK